MAEIALTGVRYTAPEDRPERFRVGDPVVATVRHNVLGSKTGWDGLDGVGASAPFPRSGGSLWTLYIEGTATDTLDIEAAYNPVLDADGNLDAGATSWVVVGSATIPASGVLAQSFEDVAPFFRLVNTTVGGSAFDVYIWYLH